MLWWSFSDSSLDNVRQAKRIISQHPQLSGQWQSPLRKKSVKTEIASLPYLLTWKPHWQASTLWLSVTKASQVWRSGVSLNSIWLTFLPTVQVSHVITHKPWCFLWIYYILCLFEKKGRWSSGWNTALNYSPVCITWLTFHIFSLAVSWAPCFVWRLSLVNQYCECFTICMQLLKQKKNHYLYCKQSSLFKLNYMWY